MAEAGASQVSAAASNETARLAEGAIVADRYRVVRLLGEGGMGAVYLAEHTLMKKRFALKMLHGEMADNEEVVGRFRREAEAAAHLEHPHVVSATDFGRMEDGSFFLVLEYVDGTSLRSALSAGPLAPARAISITRQIAAALERAHDAGIVHRDLKPENVMLVKKPDNEDFVKVLDFGVARFDAAAERETAAGQILTRLGTIMGTPEYMAPEQALGERVTPRADLYAVGVMLFEMLAGVRPFDGDEPTAVMSMHMIAPVPPIAERAPGVVVPPSLEAIVRRSMEKEPSARFPSARALLDALDDVARELGLEVASFGPPSSDRLKISPAPPPSSPSLLQGPEPFAKTAMALPSVSTSPSTRSAPTVVAKARAVATEARVQGERLLDELHVKTKLPKKTLLLAAGGAAALVLLLFVVVIALASGGKSSSTSAAASSSGGTGGFSLPGFGVATAPAEKVRAAAAKGAPALEALAEEYPKDPAVFRELAFAYDSNGRLAEALGAVKRLVDASAAAKTEIPRDVVRIVMKAASRFEVADDAFKLLEERLGALGVEALLELSESKDKDVTEKTRARAASSLGKSTVRAKAPPALVFVIDLKDASSCEEKKSVLERSGDKADARALDTLKALKSTRGCGRGKRYDCWRCLRGDDSLDRAIGAAESASSN